MATIGPNWQRHRVRSPPKKAEEKPGPSSPPPGLRCYATKNSVITKTVNVCE